MGLAERVESYDSDRYFVFQKNGHILRNGDEIRTKRTEWYYTFISCTHPRKVYVSVHDAQTGQDEWKQEYYANVLDVAIWDNKYNEWTFKANWQD